jgi:hypothetical protein
MPFPPFTSRSCLQDRLFKSKVQLNISVSKRRIRSTDCLLKDKIGNGKLFAWYVSEQLHKSVQIDDFFPDLIETEEFQTCQAMSMRKTGPG